ncbi:hypothetical protein [Planomicrobium sp. MB-3u-38]|uniref:hypothetical protein n=1 Tax=Planomicrobium sp. MB-3u-38 TaxID=2058318 RepID=UPI000C7CCC9E|nr:hypothetical protein [Planomicrobium sp. MB-3u-38]PKH12167.1 hypothetical protein CXF70_01295 [Planomicrobium sp. MB-3u-38]
MRKILFLPFLFLLLAGCSPSASELPLEMMAYNSLSKAEQDLIPVSPKDSTVKKEDVSSAIKSLIDSDYHKEQVYAVVFHDTGSNASGNLVVYIDLDKGKVVGKGYEDKE